MAAEFDRPGLASRPDAEIQRPVAPGVDVAKPKPWLWIAAAVLLGVVLAVAGAAILMRQKPQDLAIKPPVEAQQPAPPEPSAKIAERVGTASARLRLRLQLPRADRKRPNRALKARRRQRPRRPKRRTRAAAPSPSAGRAAMLVASADNPQKPVVSLGSTVWSLIPAGAGPAGDGRGEG